MAILHVCIFAAGMATGAVGALWWALDGEQAPASGPLPVPTEVAALDARQARAEAELADTPASPPVRGALACTGLGSRSETLACARAELARLGWQLGAFGRQTHAHWQRLQAQVQARRTQQAASGQ